MARLLEKTGIRTTASVLETALINIKNINARYEKSEALNQVAWLMTTYKIQIDALMERMH